MSLGYLKRLELAQMRLRELGKVTTHYQPEPVNMRGKVINWAKNKDNGPKGRATHPRVQKGK
jgi:hypothetical protein